MTLMNRVETLTVNNPVRAMLLNRIEARILLQKGGRVDGGVALELGCGRGDGAQLILERFGAARVVAIDLDPAQIERARARMGTRAEFRIGDAAALDFPDASFDAVFEFGVLHHVPAWRQALREVGRVLRPGGKFYFEDLLAELIRSRPFRALFDHPLESQFRAWEFLRGVREAGLTLLGAPTLIPHMFLAGVAEKR